MCYCSYTQFVNSPVHRHMNYFQGLTIMDKAGINIPILVFCADMFLLGKYLEMELPGYAYVHL